MLFIAYFYPTLLPAVRLSQVSPRALSTEVDKLCEKQGITLAKEDKDEDLSDTKVKEKLLKAPVDGSAANRWLFLIASVGVIFIGWIMFGLGVGWGVHGSVIAGTTGE